MKRIGNLYEKICDIENLRLVHKQVRRGKSFYTEVKLINENEDEYLHRLQDMLIHKRIIHLNMKSLRKRKARKSGRYISFRTFLIKFVNGQ